jgi:hypothetical protein
MVKSSPYKLLVQQYSCMHTWHVSCNGCHTSHCTGVWRSATTMAGRMRQEALTAEDGEDLERLQVRGQLLILCTSGTKTGVCGG